MANMGGLLDALTAGGNALQAQQFGAQVTGANVGNANAPGYHRVDPVLISAGALGTSALTAIAQRSSNGFLDANVNAQSAAFSYAQTHVLALNALQSAVGSLGDASLAAALSNFFGGFRALSANPQDMGVRTDLLGRVTSLVTSIRSAALSVAQAQGQADAQVMQSLPSLNEQIAIVAALNQQITAASAGGTPANDLMDRRDAAVKALATGLGATTAVAPNGQVSVFVGDGVSVVSGSTANLLTTSTDPTTGFHHVQVSGSTTGSLDSRITSGTLGALLTARDTDLSNNAQALDAYAFDLANAANAIHTANYGLDGVTGRQLFATHAQTGAAAALALDAAMVNNPLGFAAATTLAGVPGDAQGAVQMVSMQDSFVANGNSQTLLQSVNTMITNIGVSVYQATTSQAQTNTALLYAQSLAETQSGVSVEDQMMQLSHYQNAYQAATRFIHAIDEMLQSLQNM